MLYLPRLTNKHLIIRGVTCAMALHYKPLINFLLMKKFFFTLALVLMASASFAAVTSGGNGEEPKEEATSNYPTDQALAGLAVAALQQQCGNQHTGWQWQTNVTTISACFAGGFIKQVFVYATPNCPPNQPCIQVIQLVGTVQFGCDGDVLSVNCGFTEI